MVSHRSLSQRKLNRLTMGCDGVKSGRPLPACLIPCRWRTQVPPKYLWRATKLHCATSQRTAVFTAAAVRSSYLTSECASHAYPAIWIWPSLRCPVPVRCSGLRSCSLRLFISSRVRGSVTSNSGFWIGWLDLLVLLLQLHLITTLNNRWLPKARSVSSWTTSVFHCGWLLHFLSSTNPILSRSNLVLFSSTKPSRGHMRHNTFCIHFV
jgi:hypothetical protein